MFLFQMIPVHFVYLQYNKEKRKEERRFFMIVKNLSFGSITIDGETYVKDVIIDNGFIKKRKKAESKKYGDRFGHTTNLILHLTC